MEKKLEKEPPKPKVKSAVFAKSENSPKQEKLILLRCNQAPCKANGESVDLQTRLQRVLDLSKGATLEKSDDIVGLLVEIRKALNARRNGKRVAEPFLIETLFDTKARGENGEKAQGERARVECIVQFLGFCLDKLEKGPIPRRWLDEFMYDFADARILPEFQHKGHSSWRLRTEPVALQFGCVKSLFGEDRLLGAAPYDMLSVVELRQTLESFFKSVLGLRKVEPQVNFRHDDICKIVSGNEKKYVEFQKKSGIRLTHVAKIYKWASAVLHSNRNRDIWLVWKAIYSCKFLFGPLEVAMKVSPEGVKCMRESFVKKAREEMKRQQIRECRVFWEDGDVTHVSL